jgi:hypothetical protein
MMRSASVVPEVNQELETHIHCIRPGHTGTRTTTWVGSTSLEMSSWFCLHKRMFNAQTLAMVGG